MPTTDRETKPVVLPSKKELIMKTYLTARELRAIGNATLKFAKIGIEDVEGEGIKKQLRDFDAAGAVNAEDDELVVQAVVSYDGTDTSILDRLLDEHPEELAAVLAEARNLVPGDFTGRK